MSPDLIALARAYMALPGAPTAHAPMMVNVTADEVWFRDHDGIRWVDVAPPAVDESEWVPDLADRATGGVMLDIIRPVAMPILDCDPRTGYALRRMGERFTPGSGCATLAEAVARVAVAFCEAEGIALPSPTREPSPMVPASGVLPCPVATPTPSEIVGGGKA